jgi:hypothetical protein
MVVRYEVDRELMAMFKLRRVAAALAVFSGAALVSTAPATPAYAANSSSTVYAVSAGWKYYASYADKASCEAAGGAQSRNWQCVTSNSGAHDLYLWY